MAEKRDAAMRKLAADACAKITNAAREHDENPLEAEFKLMFSIAESLAVIVSLMLETAMGERTDEQSI